MDSALKHAAWINQHVVNVWLVEDSDAYREDVAELLNGTPDLNCKSFDSGEALFEHLESNFAPEVIFVDIGLPGMSGIEVVQRLRMISPGTQSVMLTIHEDDGKIFEALVAGAQGYLLKVAKDEEILLAAREAHRGGVPMTPQIARRVLNVFTQLKAPRNDYGLTEREQEVLEAMMQGRSKKDMGTALFVSEHTIDTHLRNIYAKLHVHSRPEAMAKVHKERLV